MSYGAVPNVDTGAGKESGMKAPVSGDWEADAKRGFIVKVYSILSVQLLFTVLACAVFMYVEPVNTFMATSGMPVFWLSFIGTIGTVPPRPRDTARDAQPAAASPLTPRPPSHAQVIGLYFYKSVHPTNLYLLAGFTVFESLLVGTICAKYQVSLGPLLALLPLLCLVGSAWGSAR
jgi:FtsH-binding integral membrane protein